MTTCNAPQLLKKIHGTCSADFKRTPAPHEIMSPPEDELISLLFTVFDIKISLTIVWSTMYDGSYQPSLVLLRTHSFLDLVNFILRTGSRIDTKHSRHVFLTSM